jgi:hypothetical protein
MAYNQEILPGDLEVNEKKSIYKTKSWTLKELFNPDL